MFTFDAKLSTAIEAPAPKPQSAPPAAPAATGPLSPDLLDKMQRYWCAANYLCVGQIYLLDNPLLREPFTKANIKPRLLGHWGTSAGQNFIYVHLNRLIRETGADIIYISGPGHGGPTLNACAFVLFPRPEEFPVTAARTRRIPCTKAANWAIRLCTHSARRSTIQV